MRGRQAGWVTSKEATTVYEGSGFHVLSSTPLRPGLTYMTVAHRTGKNGKNRLRCPVALFRSPTGTASIGYEVHDDDERKPNAECG